MNLLLQNAILCLIFGIALLAGAIANSKYSSDNLDLYDDSQCIRYEGSDYYNSVVEDICDDLETVYITEAAAAVSLRNTYNGCVVTTV